METEVQKLAARIEREKEKGLIDVKLTTALDFENFNPLNPAPRPRVPPGTTREELAGEINAMFDAPPLEDPDFF